MHGPGGLRVRGTRPVPRDPTAPTSTLWTGVGRSGDSKLPQSLAREADGATGSQKAGAVERERFPSLVFSPSEGNEST